MTSENTKSQGDTTIGARSAELRKRTAEAEEKRVLERRERARKIVEERRRRKDAAIAQGMDTKRESVQSNHVTHSSLQSGAYEVEIDETQHNLPSVRTDSDTTIETRVRFSTTKMDETEKTVEIQHNFSDESNDTPLIDRAQKERPKLTKEHRSSERRAALVVHDIQHSNSKRTSSLREQISKKSTLAEEFKDTSLKRAFDREILFLFVIPTLISIWYCAAILFPPGSNDGWRKYILWTDGELRTNETGQVMICPRESICSEGIAQVLLIAVARISAFWLYVCMAWTFASKMHSSINFLSYTHAETWIPFASMHNFHRMQGLMFFYLALIHTIAHIIRWGLRNELGTVGVTTPGISGYVAMFLMGLVVWSMTLAKNMKITFERRFNYHWLFLGVVAALCFHTKRTREITLSFAGLWFADYLYAYFFRTHRLDIVEFTPLLDGRGAQMLWRNPEGFNPASGEFVRVQVPWLTNGGHEWHPFSLYQQEATREGILEMKRKDAGRIFLEGDTKGGREVDPGKTACILVECQNEFASFGGKLHDDVRGVMESNGMLENLVKLTRTAREVGAQVFHAPLLLSPTMSKNLNHAIGILKDCRDSSLFVENTWNADFIECLKPQAGDCIVSNKIGLDSFIGTNLEKLIIEKGIETVIIGGFLTNCCVESTMRTAYEKGLNVITLTDGTACKSKEEQKAATESTFKMFSSPMTCNQASSILQGQIPDGLSNLTQDLEEGLKLENLDLSEFLDDCLSNHFEDEEDTLTLKEARKNISKRYNTTQIFVAAAGDWSNGLNMDLKNGTQQRACWVRGPYTSPYFVAKEYSNFLLTATGIGITPALAVLGQYPGNSRLKVLVWLTKSRDMVKFFAPLLKNAHIALVYYTGKEKLTTPEQKSIRDYGNIFLQQARPHPSLEGVLSKAILTFEQERAIAIDSRIPLSMNDIDSKAKAAWCVLYCGGSIMIKDKLKKFAKDAGTGWKKELFDW